MPSKQPPPPPFYCRPIGPCQMPRQLSHYVTSPPYQRACWQGTLMDSAVSGALLWWATVADRSPLWTPSRGAIANPHTGHGTPRATFRPRFSSSCVSGRKGCSSSLPHLRVRVGGVGLASRFVRLRFANFRSERRSLGPICPFANITIMPVPPHAGQTSLAVCAEGPLMPDGAHSGGVASTGNHSSPLQQENAEAWETSTSYKPR